MLWQASLVLERQQKDSAKQAYAEAEARKKDLAKSLADTEKKVDQLQETLQRLFSFVTMPTLNFLFLRCLAVELRAGLYH